MSIYLEVSIYFITFDMKSDEKRLATLVDWQTHQLHLRNE